MVSKKISHKPICLNEYQGYVYLFGMLRFIEAAGVKGDLEDLWFDLGHHVRVFRDEDDVQPPIDVRMFFSLNSLMTSFKKS